MKQPVISSPTSDLANAHPYRSWCEGLLQGRDLKRADGTIYYAVYLISQNLEVFKKYSPVKKEENPRMHMVRFHARPPKNKRDTLTVSHGSSDSPHYCGNSGF